MQMNMRLNWTLTGTGNIIKRAVTINFTRPVNKV